MHVGKVIQQTKWALCSIVRPRQHGAAHPIVAARVLEMVRGEKDVHLAVSAETARWDFERSERDRWNGRRRGPFLRISWLRDELQVNACLRIGINGPADTVLRAWA